MVLRRLSFPNRCPRTVRARPRGEVTSLRCLTAGLVAGLWLAWVPAGRAEEFVLNVRQREAVATNAGVFRVIERIRRWDARQTAVVVCDMWDRHWCQGATARVAEMAPRLNALLQAARARGALIIHCPSDTLRFYEGTPQRQRARSAPKIETRAPIQGWCSRNAEREPPLPIDDSDGGCDDAPQCRQGNPWTRQIAALETASGDAISDSAEVIYLLAQRGIDHVLIAGVHLNMCVLGRPFGIRQLVAQSKEVVLVRDLTDTMYNSRRPPQVSHFTGTDLMIEHVEKYWCGSITSDDLLGGGPFRFAADNRPRVVALLGEDEYQTPDTFPLFAAEHLVPRGVALTILHELETDRGRFPGLERALVDADALLVSVRRRALPPAQLEVIRRHLDRGGGLVGIRTASHAFAPRGTATQPEPGRGQWPEFDAEVLGGNYHGHHGAGPKTAITVASGAAGHPALAGIDFSDWVGHGSLYRTSPLRPGTTLLLEGTIAGQPPEPLAWVRTLDKRGARVFYTSLGHPDDFAEPGFRRLLVNGIAWAAGRSSQGPRDVVE